MFFDIGKKIMQYVKIVCVIGVICTMIMMVFDIVSITSMSYAQKVALYGSSDNTAAILSSVFSHLLIAAGIYVGSWVLYAFGQLVDDVHAMCMKDTSATSIEEDKKREDAGIVPLQQTKKAQEAESIPVNPAPKVSKEEAKNQGSESKEAPQLLDKNQWNCSCGRTNLYYVVTCVCGIKKEKAE